MDLVVQTSSAIKSEVTPSDPSGYVRHEKHYYEDGNIVFVVERTLFRLYRGLLARHSEVMQNMFGLASHDMEAQEKIDGAPAVTLVDSAIDFANLLDFLLTPSVPPYPPTSPDFETLISVLRISSKYLFDSIREAAVWHLRDTLPTTLDDFVGNPGLTMFTGVRAAQVASAAREFQLPEFLPLALYAITTYAWRSTDVDAAELVHAALPMEDLARTVVGRTRIHSEALKLAYTMHEHGLMSGATAQCASPMTHSRTCAKGRPTSLWMNPAEALDEFLRNPLRQLVIRDTCEFHSLCRPCVDAIRVKMETDLKCFFNKLPEIFQLEVPQEFSNAGEDTLEAPYGKPSGTPTIIL